MPTLSAEQIERAKERVLRVEQLLARLASERAEYVKRSNAIKQEIGSAYRAARDHGLQVGMLKHFVEDRALKREQEQIVQSLSDAEAKALVEYLRRGEAKRRADS